MLDCVGLAIVPIYFLMIAPMDGHTLPGQKKIQAKQIFSR